MVWRATTRGPRRWTMVVVASVLLLGSACSADGNRYASATSRSRNESAAPRTAAGSATSPTTRRPSARDAYVSTLTWRSGACAESVGSRVRLSECNSGADYVVLLVGPSRDLCTYRYADLKNGTFACLMPNYANGSASQATSRDYQQDGSAGRANNVDPPYEPGDLNRAGCTVNQYVRGYTRSDGTRVSGYWRNSPSDSCQ